MHGLEASRTFLDRLLRRRVSFSLEIVSTKKAGIRYLLRVPEADADTFEQTILAYLPDSKIRRADDYLASGRLGRALEIKQTGYFAYPLHTQLALYEHDPISYLTGMMTKLAPHELIGFQIVVVPVKMREAGVIASRMMQNDELVYQLGRRRLGGMRVFNAINSVLFGILDGIGDVVSGPNRSHKNLPEVDHRRQAAMKIKPSRMLSTLEQQLANSVHDKISQPLFRVNVRVFVAMEDKQRERQRIKGLREWLAVLAVPKYQALKVRHSYARMQELYRLSMFRQRMPALWQHNACVFSAAELADLYHFPHPEAAKTENVVKSFSKTLPAPLSLKNGSRFDVVLGQNVHHGTTTEIGLTAAERERHVFIIGGTGNGKTTMLEYGIVQDMQNGKGVAIIDPHGDLAEKLLRYVPDHRIKDVIYFNPVDIAYPMGVNLLEQPSGLSEDELLIEQDFITESVVSIFRKIFSEDDSGGHRIEHFLRNTIHTAFTVPDATLFTVYKLLVNAKFRKSVVSKLIDEDLIDFWKGEFNKAGDYQKVKMSGGVNAKLGRFQRSAVSRRVLEQPKSTLDFDDIIQNKKILICNFSKGQIGEDTSELFGISVLAKLQLAAYRRVKRSQGDREPFYLYVDEFQNFATLSFVQMLSEARKYKLFLTMAEQSTSQQDDLRMVNTILANAGTVICFRSGSPADEKLILPLFRPYVEEGEIANLPTYNFYARMSAVLSQEPVSGETIVLADKGSEDIAERVITASRANYAKQYKAAPELKPLEKKGKIKQTSEPVAASSGKPTE